MSDATEFPELDVSFRGGRLDTDTAVAILVGIALASLIGIRMTFRR